MGKLYTQAILWMGILGRWAADPGGESTERTGRNMHRAFEVMKPCICWRRPYLLPSSFLVEEILSQYEKEGQMLGNNVKTQPSEQFYSPLHLRRWEGKQSLFIRSWVNYLSLSYMATDMIFEMEKPQNVVMIETDKHRPCSIARLPFVISLCVWSLERGSEILANCLKISALSLSQKLAIKSAGQDSQRSTLWQHTTRLPNTVQAASALSFLEISYCPLKPAVLNLSAIR